MRELTIESFEQSGVEMLITHALHENSTPAVIATAVRQFGFAVARTVVHQVAPEMELVGDGHTEHGEKCSVDEPHEHIGILWRVVPLTVLEEEKKRAGIND